MKQFRTYQLALDLYKACKDLKIPYYLKDQLQRASSSIVLNLAEGSAKPTQKDRMKFYAIAFGSTREVQAIIAMEPAKLAGIHDLADHVGACLYKLTRPG